MCVFGKKEDIIVLCFFLGVYFTPDGQRAKNEMNETARVMGDLKLMEDAPKRYDWLNVSSLKSK